LPVTFKMWGQRTEYE